MTREGKGERELGWETMAWLGGRIARTCCDPGRDVTGEDGASRRKMSDKLGGG